MGLVLEAPDHDGDVVFTAAIERQLHQPLTRLLRDVRRAQLGFDLRVGHIAGEAVGAEQDDIVPATIGRVNARRSVAPAEGRALYASLGFRPTNEMRLLL